MKQLSQFTALLISALVVVAVALITAARASDIIQTSVFIGGLLVSGIIGYLDAKWIDRHFVDGEWK